jgi:hypothetical protein
MLTEVREGGIDSGKGFKGSRGQGVKVIGDFRFGILDFKLKNLISFNLRSAI